MDGIDPSFECSVFAVCTRCLTRRDRGVKLPRHPPSLPLRNSFHDGRGPRAPGRIGREDRREGRSRKSQCGNGASGPARLQRNPEQLVQGRQSTARLMRVQSQQLLTKSEVFKDKVLPGTKSADHRPEEMPERHVHARILSENFESCLAPSHLFCGCTTF